MHIQMSGYREKRIPIACDLNYVTFLNILIGGVPGLLVDSFDGAMGKLKPEAINVNLEPTSALAGPMEKGDESNMTPMGTWGAGVARRLARQGLGPSVRRDRSSLSRYGVPSQRLDSPATCSHSQAP